MVKRTAGTNIESDIAAIIATLEHMATKEQVARLEKSVEHLEKQIIQSEDTTKIVQKTSGWKDAKENSIIGLRGNIAIILALLAVIITLIPYFGS
jgi:hypothetical protein